MMERKSYVERIEKFRGIKVRKSDDWKGKSLAEDQGIQETDI